MFPMDRGGLPPCQLLIPLARSFVQSTNKGFPVAIGRKPTIFSWKGVKSDEGGVVSFQEGFHQIETVFTVGFDMLIAGWREY